MSEVPFYRWKQLAKLIKTLTFYDINKKKWNNLLLKTHEIECNGPLYSKTAVMHYKRCIMYVNNKILL